jgi:hypothetical protein
MTACLLVAAHSNRTQKVQSTPVDNGKPSLHAVAFAGIKTPGPAECK